MATWVPTSDRATNSPFTIYDGTTARGTVRVDQQQTPDSTNGGVTEWYGNQPFRRLGGRYVINGSNLTVKLGNNAGNSTANQVVADAIWVRRVAATILDDRDVNFNITPVTGNTNTGWAYYASTNTPGYLQSHYAANCTGSVSNVTACATWNFANILPGQYEIWATWVDEINSRSANAPFVVKDGSTSITTFNVDERYNPATSGFQSESFGGVNWRNLGTANISSQQLQVILQNNTNEANRPLVVADGIRIKRISNYLIDDAEPSFTATNLTDSWNYYASTAEYGYANDHTGLMKTTTSANATGSASWNFTNLPSGSFKVYASWREANNRATNARYRVNSSAYVTLDQTKAANSTSLTNFDKRGGNEPNTYFQEIGTYSSSSGNLTVTLDNYGVSQSNFVIADAIYIKYVGPLMATGQFTGDITVGSALTDQVPQPMIDAAIQRWKDAGISPQQLARLQATNVEVLDLSSGYLGFDDAGVVEISRDGNGAGWFIDPTPNEDSEFRNGVMVTPKGFDLLTVLEHEFGHILGFDDLPSESYPNELMADTILPGARKVAADSIYREFSGLSKDSGVASRIVTEPMQLSGMLAVKIHAQDWLDVTETAKGATLPRYQPQVEQAMDLGQSRFGRGDRSTKLKRTSGRGNY